MMHELTTWRLVHSANTAVTEGWCVKKNVPWESVQRYASMSRKLSICKQQCLCTVLRRVSPENQFWLCRVSRNVSPENCTVSCGWHGPVTLYPQWKFLVMVSSLVNGISVISPCVYFFINFSFIQFAEGGDITVSNCRSWQATKTQGRTSWPPLQYDLMLMLLKIVIAFFTGDVQQIYAAIYNQPTGGSWFWHPNPV